MSTTISTPELHARVEKDVKTICTALGYDLNTVEFAIKDGVPYAIDFMNPAPDAELASVGEYNHRWIVDNMTDFILKKLENRLGNARIPLVGNAQPAGKSQQKSSLWQDFCCGPWFTRFISSTLYLPADYFAFSAVSSPMILSSLSMSIWWSVFIRASISSLASMLVL